MTRDKAKKIMEVHLPRREVRGGYKDRNAHSRTRLFLSLDGERWRVVLDAAKRVGRVDVSILNHVLLFVVLLVSCGISFDDASIFLYDVMTCPAFFGPAEV